jgi:hypothetical protein
LKSALAILFAFCLLILNCTSACAEDGVKPFKLQVVDEQTGRGVPLVELRTVNGIRFWTDSAGVVAFDEPGLLGREVFFFVESHGYEFAKDGFGYRGRRVTTTPGGEAVWKIRRLNIAERLYRVTGEGIYRDTVLLGETPPARQPLLNAGVLGSDSVLTALYRGRVYWFWGDTNRASYPLGNFHVPGATSRLSSDGGLDIERGVDLEYFSGDGSDGFAKETARMPGAGPTWLSGLTVLKGEDRRERMLAAYAKIRGSLDVYQRGLVEFNDERQAFDKLSEFDLATPLYPDGHPLIRREGETDYVCFAAPLPMVRVPATVEAFTDLSRYEAYTCLVEGSRPDEMRLDRDAAGRLRYAWKRNTPPVNQELQQKLVRAGIAKAEELLVQLRDVETGKTVRAHGGSVYWNEHRRRWVAIFVEVYGGPSFLGEVWYAEADTPLGPWAYARRIVTHDKYSFYNPKQHPMFDKQDGRVIFFEGTYTHTFSGNDDATPRYDYNQVLYKLDLADARLALPVAFYDLSHSGEPAGSRFGDALAARRASADQPRSPAFFALDRAVEGTVPIFLGDKDGELRLVVDESNGDSSRTPLFFALPSDVEPPPPETVPLYEFIDGDQRHIYATSADLVPEGFRRAEVPLCRVWRSPTTQRFLLVD